MKKSLIGATRIVYAAVTVLLGLSVNTLPAAAGGVGYGFHQTLEGVKWMTESGKWLANSWLIHEGKSYHLDENGVFQHGWTPIDGSVYYLLPDGGYYTGWQLIDGSIYYFDADGKLAVNTVVEGHRIGEDGKYIPEPDTPVTVSAKKQIQQTQGTEGSDSTMAQYLNSIIDSVCTDGMSTEQKLKACYQYIMDHTSYLRSYDTPSGDWVAKYASEALTTGKGNCYRYAAAFACLAKQLGYPVKVVTGQIQAVKGGTTPHAWVEIVTEGDWYVYDCEMQDSKGQDLYHRTYENYPIKPLNKETEWAVIY